MAIGGEEGLGFGGGGVDGWVGLSGAGVSVRVVGRWGVGWVFGVDHLYFTSVLFI